MSDSPTEDVDVESLQELTLSDLVALSDDGGTDTVESMLSEALQVANNFLEDHGKPVSSLPGIAYDPLDSGVTYDPYHDEGETLIIGGPRGLLRGGEDVLGDRGLLRQKSLLAILCKGLLHSYNNELVTEHFERYGGSDASHGSSRIELYDRFRMLNPAVDEGITQLFVLYLHGDVTDSDLRSAYIEGWVAWFEREGFDAGLFRAVAEAIGARIDDAEGTEKERFTTALDVQEPLIRDADVSVLAGHLRK